MVTTAPKGKNASFIILKHWMPLGMPIIVTQFIIPETRYMKANSQPPKTAQMTFAMGCALKLRITDLPKGKRDSLAALKHCKPRGMPMMVMQRRRPRSAQTRARARPPKMNQIMFAINRITVTSKNIIFKYSLQGDYITNANACQQKTIYTSIFFETCDYQAVLYERKNRAALTRVRQNNRICKGGRAKNYIIGRKM